MLMHGKRLPLTFGAASFNFRLGVITKRVLLQKFYHFIASAEKS